MSVIKVGQIEAAPGFKGGVFNASSFVSYPTYTPSCFEEGAISFSHADRLVYSIGKRVEGQVRQCFNPYQGTMRLIYEPYYDDTYSSTRIIYEIYGHNASSYFRVYIKNGVIYAEMSGVSTSGSSTVRQAYANWPGSFTIGDKIHIVVQWDVYARTASENYLEIYVNSSAGTQCSSFINVLYWRKDSRKTFVLGNGHKGGASCEGKVLGFIIDDRLWGSEKIVADYNGGSFRRMVYAVSYDTIFSFPFERNGSVNDYRAFGVDRAASHEVGPAYGQLAGTDVFPLQNKNGTIVRDSYMFANDSDQWEEDGVKVGKTNDPRYTKYGRNSLKIVGITGNKKTHQTFTLSNGGPMYMDGDIYITPSSWARVSIHDYGGLVWQSSITATGWSRFWGAFDSVLNHDDTRVDIEVFGLGSNPGIAYLDRMEIHPNWVRRGGFEVEDYDFGVGDPWRVFGSGTAQTTDSVQHSGSRSLWTYNARVTLGYVYQSNPIPMNGDRYLCRGSVYENWAAGAAANQFGPLYALCDSSNNLRVIHSFAEYATATHQVWNEWNFCIPKVDSAPYHRIAYGRAANNQTFFADDVMMLEMETYTPETYFAGTGDFGAGAYGIENTAVLVDGRDVIRYNFSTDFMNTSSGGVLVEFKPQGSWFYDGEEHIIFSYGTGVVLKKTADNVFQFVYGTASASIGVGSCSPIVFNRVGAGWDQAGGNLSITGGGAHSSYSGVVPAIVDADVVCLGNEEVPTGDKALNGYINEMRTFNQYVTVDGWENLSGIDDFSGTYFSVGDYAPPTGGIIVPS